MPQGQVTDIATIESHKWLHAICMFGFAKFGLPLCHIKFVAFSDAMADFGYNMPKEPKDWMQAFIMLKNALKNKVSNGERCIIFIDELPAMDAEGSNVASAIGYFWNNWA